MTEQRSKKEFRERYYEERRERKRRKSKKQEQPKSFKTSASQPSLVQSEIPKSTEDKTQVQGVSKEIEESSIIPAINLGKPVISFKTASLVLDYPREKKEHRLIVPKFRISSPTFEFSSVKLDTSFSTRKEIHSLVVPKIKLLKPIFELSEGKLDIDYSISKQEREVFIPEFVAQKPSMSFEMASLNVEVLIPQPSHQSAKLTAQAQSEGIREINGELVEPIQPQEEITQVLHTAEAHVRGAERGGGGEELELRDPLEFLFGEGAGKVRDTEPLVILFKDTPNDSYIETFKTLLLRLYRERYGGYLDVKKLTLREDWNKREIEQWLDEGNLFLIDLGSNEAKKKEITKVKLDAKMLADRLWAIFSKRKGIVIFYTKDDKTFEDYAALLNEINWNKLHLGTKIVKIKPRKLSFEEKLKLEGLLFGFVDIKGETPPSASMDAVLNASKDKYERELKKLEEEYYNILGIVKEGDNESIEHLRGKTFIVHWLIRQLEENGIIPKGKKKNWKFIKDSVKTEEPKNGVIVDVCFEDDNYEFETLFEEGFGKIHRTLRKYEQFQANVRIIVEPITAFLHAKEFAKLMKLVKEVYPTLNARFYTLDLKNERIMPLEDYLKRVKEAYPVGNIPTM